MSEHGTTLRIAHRGPSALQTEHTFLPVEEGPPGVRLSQTEPAPQHARRTGVDQQERPSSDRPWQAVVWNDPINLMSYVVFVLQRHFGYSRSRADRLMRQIHHEGRAVVSHGSRERVESDVQAMHGYGLQATMEQEDQG